MPLDVEESAEIAKVLVTQSRTQCAMPKVDVEKRMAKLFDEGASVTKSAVKAKPKPKMQTEVHEL